ncbi:MAG: flagellar hook-length control protein FliK, partial [bacterium]|nr:flagellar hook-length control protein FliK [bacterium]
RAVPLAARSGAPAPPSAPRPPASPEGALLERLRVPATPTTLAAARLRMSATQSLTSAYEHLDAALAKLAPDPRVASARSLLSFVGKFDLRAPAALPEQIAAFVAHIVDAAEGKLAQFARAAVALAQSEVLDAAPTPAPSAPTAATAGHDAAPQAPAALPAAPAPAADAANAAAHVAERAVALEHDVKSALLALVQSPPRDASPAVVQSVRDALVATTAVQLNVLSAQSSDPNAVTIPLPAYFYEGGKPAQLRITRDAPGSKRTLDADNFHIAFVLDTKRLGTVAIDVQTVGRAVSVDVKTQSSGFAQRFRSTLGDLRGRLESLRYRVAAIDANAAPVGQTANVPAAFENTRDAAIDEGGASSWDMRA